MSLKIGIERALPLKFLSLRKVVFGGSGSGKTSFGRVLIEEATAAGVLCGAIDLKGDFWGLKSTANGQGDGIPIVIFGGEHQVCSISATRCPEPSRTRTRRSVCDWRTRRPSPSRTRRSSRASATCARRRSGRRRRV